MYMLHVSAAASRYGRSVIPMNVAEEDLLKYYWPDRALELLGFDDKSNVG